MDALNSVYFERARDLQWILKISKLCNLRCNYCYEYSDLGNPRRMTGEQLSSLFRNIAQFKVHADARHQFIWHGGEPTLLPTSYFAEAIAIQRQIFSDLKYAPKNKIQTNLYVLTDDWLDFLGSGIFDSIGVSFDGVGGHRVNAVLQDSVRKTVSNMERLRANGIRFGIICVLSKRNLGEVLKIVDFCESIGCDCRFLPIYKDNYNGQNDSIACSVEEVLGAMCLVADHWLSSKSDIIVQPIASYFRKVTSFLASGDSAVYEKVKDTNIFIVNTNGDIFGDADDYRSEYRYLNIFDDDLNTLSRSPGWAASVDASGKRVQATCVECKFSGLCNRFPIAEATRRETNEELLGVKRCTLARPLFAHLSGMLQEPPRELET